MRYSRLIALAACAWLTACEKPDVHVLVDSVNWACSTSRCDVEFRVDNKAHFRREVVLQILAERRIEVGDTVEYTGLGEQSQAIEIGGRERRRVRATIVVVQQPDRVSVTVLDPG